MVIGHREYQKDAVIMRTLLFCALKCELHSESAAYHNDQMILSKTTDMCAVVVFIMMPHDSCRVAEV